MSIKHILFTIPLTILSLATLAACTPHQRLHYDLNAAHEDFHQQPHSRAEHRRLHGELDAAHEREHERGYSGGRSYGDPYYGGDRYYGGY
ncbi:MAG: hypothetical protein ACRERD_25550 [Candidatus Binatia bacterium]